MKKWMLVLLILSYGFPAFAQKETVLTQDDTWVLYSKFENQIAEMAGDTAVLGGIYAGGLLNGRLMLGAGINTLLFDVDTDSPFLEELEFMDVWYTGFHSGYTFFSDRLVHFSVGCLVGGGEVETETVQGRKVSETIFAIQPTIDFRLNITQRFSIGFNAGYLHIEMDDFETLGSSDLSGPTAGFFLHFTQY